jgi:hypothetical protein
MSRLVRRSAGYQVANTWSTWCGPSTSNGLAVSAGSGVTAAPAAGRVSGRRRFAAFSASSARGPRSAPRSRVTAAGSAVVVGRNVYRSTALRSDPDR